MRNENGIITSNQKLTLGKHVLRAILILTILLPFIMEIYFLIPNLASFYSGKEWVRVVLNTSHKSEIKVVNELKPTESQLIERKSIDNNDNTLVMLIKDPISHIVFQDSNFEKSGLKSGLRRNLRGVQIGGTNIHSSGSNLKLSKKILSEDRLLVRKDDCNCPILENSTLDMTEGGNFYSLILDGQNSVNNPILIQVISLICLLFKWIILLMYVTVQLLLPLNVVRQAVNEKILKSSAISIFYVTSTSLSLSITGIEGSDCISWWFLGTSPEYVLITQVFIWLVASVCMFLYLVQYFLELAFNISRRHKLVNDFITTSIFIPAGLLIITSVSLCILGIIKPWILMVWIIIVILEFEKNLRILTKIYDEGLTSNTEAGMNRNSILFQTINNNNFREESSNEINIVELAEENNLGDLEKIKEKDLKARIRKESEMVIIPISNSYFKILDYSFENFSSKLCLWHIIQHKEIENNSTSKVELEEVSNKSLLKLLEFSISDFVKNLNLEEKSQNNNLTNSYSLKLNSISQDSTFSSSSTFNTENLSESNNNQFICNICFIEFDSIVIFSPCGHGNVCLECLGDYISNNFKLKQHPKCHICREDISRMIEIKKEKNQSNENNYILEETKSFESTLSNKINNVNKNNQREICLISNIKLIAEISSISRNTSTSNYSASSRSQSLRSSNSSIITLKISRSNSDLWSHPRIKEFINNNQSSNLKIWIYNHFTRFFTNSSRRSR